ncbi:hypothetical protein WKI71_17740 [Streptomyces sp. MS1.AVA.1]|uniref:Lipoprotein n=1 Tax=Streptomyces machairae TaxID=3134109 RepID=A0ABU8UM69_9ACTN
MPTASRTVPAALAGVLLLAACGSQSASQGDGATRARGAGAPVSAASLCPSDFVQYGSPPPSVEPAVTPSGTPTPLPLPSSTDGPGEDGVKVTGLYAWGRTAAVTPTSPPSSRSPTRGRRRPLTR